MPLIVSEKLAILLVESPGLLGRDLKSSIGADLAAPIVERV